MHRHLNPSGDWTYVSHLSFLPQLYRIFSLLSSFSLDITAVLPAVVVLSRGPRTLKLLTFATSSAPTFDSDKLDLSFIAFSLLPGCLAFALLLQSYRLPVHCLRCFTLCALSLVCAARPCFHISSHVHIFIMTHFYPLDIPTNQLDSAINHDCISILCQVG